MKIDWEKTSYRIISGFFDLMGRVPRKTAIRISSSVGHFWFAVDKRHRDVAVNNLTDVFGKEKSAAEIRQLTRQIFCNLVRVLFEIGWMRQLKEKDFSRYFHIHGLHHLETAYKKGKGVLVLTGHMGNWELLSLAAAILGYPMSAIYRPLDFKPLNRFFVELRSRYGAKMYPKKNAMRPVLKGLKQKELIGILLDQNTSASAGVFVDFFGRKACTNKGLALIARGTGAPVISLFLLREDDHFRIEFGPEIPLIRSGDKIRDIEANTRQYNRVLESVIRRYPDQWFWVHRRWKTRPPTD